MKATINYTTDFFDPSWTGKVKVHIKTMAKNSLMTCVCDGKHINREVNKVY